MKPVAHAVRDIVSVPLAVNAFADDPGPTRRGAGEERLAPLAPQRRREFATVRQCARDAHRQLGMRSQASFTVPGVRP
jgi:4'-phosphopantetheinyl transferase EntD